MVNYVGQDKNNKIPLMEFDLEEILWCPFAYAITVCAVQIARLNSEHSQLTIQLHASHSAKSQ